MNLNARSYKPYLNFHLSKINKNDLLFTYEKYIFECVKITLTSLSLVVDPKFMNLDYFLSQMEKYVITENVLLDPYSKLKFQSSLELLSDLNYYFSANIMQRNKI